MILLPKDSWEIKITQNKGRGIFAKKNISKGTVIGDYLGTVIHPKDAEVNDDNFYLMYYHDLAVITPDLNKPGVHLLNHACFPNAWLYTYKGHTLAFALKNISKGEEITINYLLSPLDQFCNPCKHVCHCGDKRCTKIMHLKKKTYDAWRKLNEAQSKETRRAKIRYGHDLPPLSSYPEIIPNDYMEKVNALINL